MITSLRVGDDSYRIHRIGDLAPEELPYSLRILLENLIRHGYDDQVAALTQWDGTPRPGTAVDLHPSRAFLHDTNGVPTLVDLAAMRDAIRDLGGDPGRVNPLIPAELVIDHSVIADVFGTAEARERNVEIEYGRNAERYRFLRWGQQNLRNFAVVPPGTGIMHQVNVEHLARVVTAENGQAFPDVCLGTDSHTTMVNGLGVLGWGIGGIEAEAVMLGQSLSIPLPEVVGVRLHGRLPDGATATDLVLTITELLRRHGVVGRFVEFSGPGVNGVTLADRATIANMAPEFGSTCAYFPIDDETLRYLRFTGRTPRHVALVEAYAKEQGLWHDPERVVSYSQVVDLDLGVVEQSLAGPRRPQDRLALSAAKAAFRETARDLPPVSSVIEHGHVAIAAITSCTNTSNPAVMVAAGLLARNAVARGLRSKPWVKTTLSPGSRVVTSYYDQAGLTSALEKLGFHLTGYGCMTCIGASGPLIPEVAAAVREHDISVVSVLSGNRNFDGRINPDVRMNYLASPPLVVAYAIAGTMDLDLTTEPLGTGSDGEPVHLRDIWPSPREVQDVVESSITPRMFTDVYADVFTGDSRWQALDIPHGATFTWDETSAYLRRPPYFDAMTPSPGERPELRDARVLVKLGDSITTDHICPAGAIPLHTPAGRYLTELGVAPFEINTYASRRGNHEVMMRGTFANVRLRNQLVPGTEGGFTRLAGQDAVIPVYDAAMAYRQSATPLIVLAGKDYGTGSSRDWAAKGPALLGVRAVIAESYERIHRSNLVGMGILPLQFPPGESADSLGLTGRERYDITRSASGPAVTVTAGTINFTATVRLDTAREAEYYRHGGIMPYVLRQLLATAPEQSRGPRR
ncbi:aconitate hydratase [Actinoplanes italicus]|uniref:Aconitate hydratase n=1 Tax=Actinoplanes italicus TaxID=113567 RepID=A0A2T0JZJ6_9ACTN|nr:aconitate hydratase AcnA [Actinoplanes italicus]PRX15928.1 aconitase [Actinoplanes italicus]GIE28728.1 aconitate hydratase [Actinoplanes italicus]